MIKLALLVCLLTTVDDRPDIVLADFEGDDYAGWAVDGEAFGAGPARGTLPNQMAVDGFLGRGLVNTYFQGDDTIGTLLSPEFRIERKLIKFLIGGGRRPDDAYIRLLIGGEEIARSTGRESEFLDWKSWDVSKLEGKTARIEIVDRARGGWGHINVDQIVQSDAKPDASNEKAALLAKAEAGVKEAIPRAQDDPDRPTFHVLPPSRWMNDPNGPIYYNGYYHIFYQHNPYHDDWGNMHWGHARSKDLARWEHRPIALWPSRSLGEDHVFSGCATIGKDGKPIVFYTSIGGRLPEQWAATPDDDSLDSWTKHPANPILTEKLHGNTKVHEWRDPFVFEVGDKTYMVLGGNLNGNKGGEGIVAVYHAEDPELTKWTYLGPLFQHPDAGVKNVECPLFFPIGNKWVLIVSQGRPVDWFVGDLDPKTMKFTATSRGKLDLGEVYAPNVLMNDPKDRKILWGWMNGVPANKGWRHCMTLPRVLTIAADGTLAQQPAPELETLRGPDLIGAKRVPAAPIRVDALSSALEIVATLSKPGRLAIDEDLAIDWDGKALDVAGTKVPLALPAGTPLDLRVFIDHAILEVYANGRACVTKSIARLDGPLVISEATGVSSLAVYKMGTIWSK